MTYDQIIAFIAVAHEGGFSAASETLHKSQPAVSKLVRNLEDELGVTLFDRTQYRATLSDAGRLFLGTRSDRAAGRRRPAGRRRSPRATRIAKETATEMKAGGESRRMR